MFDSVLKNPGRLIGQFGAATTNGKTNGRSRKRNSKVTKKRTASIIINRMNDSSSETEIEEEPDSSRKSQWMNPPSSTGWTRIQPVMNLADKDGFGEGDPEPLTDVDSENEVNDGQFECLECGKIENLGAQPALSRTVSSETSTELDFTPIIPSLGVGGDQNDRNEEEFRLQPTNIPLLGQDCQLTPSQSIHSTTSSSSSN